jgi:hypothetical protein
MLVETDVQARTSFLDIYRYIARRGWLSCTLVCAIPLLIRAALLPVLPVPAPSVHDEFAYLLASDTYASGRLTNPPHPFWQHFETFHVIQQPAYAAKYPPLPGLVLAFGQALFGQPWIGVWLSVGLMCATICWALRGWIGDEWGFGAGLIVALRVGVMSYWMNSYMGGAVAAAGGALVLGAVPRLARNPLIRDALWLAAGLSILMLSRPYEGAWMGLLGCLALTWWLRKNQVPFRKMAGRIVLPAGIVLAIALAFLAYQNYRVTGNPLELPYLLHDQQYEVSSIFFWSPLRPEPVYRHSVIRDYWARWQVENYNKARRDPFALYSEKLGMIYYFFFGFWPLLVPPLVWPYRLKTTEEKLTLLILLVFLAAIFPLCGILPHYVAPITACLYLRFFFTLKRLWAWRPSGKPVGFAIAIFSMCLVVAPMFISVRNTFRDAPEFPLLEVQRQRVVQELEKHPGQHVVLVRYKPTHTVHIEWVYNRADIDAAPILWAREMGPTQDQPFVEYYKGRNIWLLDADDPTPKLTPYK